MNDGQIMNDGVEPREGRTVRLGIAAFRFDPETIQRMLRFLEVPWESTRIETVTVPLISAKLLLSRPCIVMQVNWGRGEFVFSNSAGLPEDRADIVTHLLKTAAGRRPQAASAPPSPAPNADELVDAITGLFEVYDEIPLDVVARELAAKSATELTRLDLLAAIEKCIRSGELAARIRGNTIVRAW